VRIPEGKQLRKIYKENLENSEDTRLQYVT
jgi:hypothetical protein